MRWLLSVTTLVLVACGSTPMTDDAGSLLDAGTADAGEPPFTELRFKAKVGAQPFACGQTYAALGTSASSYSPADLRFYVSDVKLTLHGDVEVPFVLDANAYQRGAVALLDFEDATGDCANGTPTTHTTLTGSAPRGHVHQLSFTVGLPFELNHADVSTAAAPLDLSAMFWSWQAGYKFLKVDGLVGTELRNVHVGSTGCMAGTQPNSVESCSALNTISVTIDDFDPETQAVVFDVAALLAGSDLSVDLGGAPGCMSGPTDPECAPLFGKLGLPFGGVAAGTQTVFSAE